MKSADRFPWFWIFMLLLCEVLAWMFDKLAIIHSSGDGFEFYWSLLTKPWIWVSFAPLPIQFFIWTHILSKTDLSRAYPATSLSYPLTMIAATIFFSENPSLMVWLGGLFVTIGVAIIGTEQANEEMQEGISEK